MLIEPSITSGKCPFWQIIRDALTKEISDGTFGPGERLPSDNDLAKRFGANRHTVRRAISDLQTHGIVRSEKGRGTFVVEDVLEYHLSNRTRFTENLIANKKLPARQVLSNDLASATERVSEKLNVPLGQEVAVVSLFGEADGIAITISRRYFPFFLIDHVTSAFVPGTTLSISITDILREAGITDYVRTTTQIGARLPTLEEARILRMGMNIPLLKTDSLDSTVCGKPIMYTRAVHHSGRVQFSV